jgi:hypothetical protein
VAACKLGKYVHHGVLASDEVDSELMQACRDNGLWHDDGPAACRASLASGLRKAKADQLPALRTSPALGDRPERILQRTCCAGEANATDEDVR